MTGEVHRRLAALLVLFGLVAMHGFGVGHDVSHCSPGTTEWRTSDPMAQPAGAPVVHERARPHATGPDASAGRLRSEGPAAPAGWAMSQVMEVGLPLISTLPTGAATGTAAQAPGDCDAAGMGGLCVAVLVASILLALLLVALRRHPLGWLAAHGGLGASTLDARTGSPPQARPSLSQLCVLRT